MERLMMNIGREMWLNMLIIRIGIGIGIGISIGIGIIY
jgi:hypothetical protein